MNSAQLCILLENGIEEFSALVHADESEQEFQRFFEENITLFQALGYSNAIPHPIIESRAQGKFIPDFIVQRDDGLWQILELKRPNTKALKNSARRDSWYAEMQGYLSQCIDYIDQLKGINLFARVSSAVMASQCIRVSQRQLLPVYLNILNNFK